MLKFMCIGAQKSGTTWLYQQLIQHPAIHFPGGKEVHFWNQRIKTDGLSWYQQLFSADPSCIEGDITPAYSMLDESEIRRIKAEYPDIRLLLMLRNPIERAWSAALMALARAEMTHDEASDQWFLDHFNSQGSRLRGDYVRTIRNWSAVYGMETLLVLDYERLSTEPLSVLRECSAFIGVPMHDGWSEAEVASRVFQGLGHPLRPSLIEPLLSIYRPKIDELSQLMGRSYAAWYEKFDH